MNGCTTPTRSASAPPDVRPRLLWALLLWLPLLSACQPGEPPYSSVTVAAHGLLAADLSADGTFGVTASLHHGGAGWDFQQDVRRYAWNHAAGEFSLLRTVAVSANGRRAVTVGERGMVMWDATSGESLGFWQVPGKVLDIALTADGSRALLGLRDNQAVLMDMLQGRPLQVLQHAAEVHAVAISADGAILMTGTDGSEALIWRDSGELLHRIEHSNQVRSVALSPDGRRAFSAALRDHAQVFELGSARVLGRLPLRSYNITTAQFSANGQSLYLGSFQGDVLELDAGSAAVRRHWQSGGAEPFGRGSRAILAVSVAPGGGLQSLSSSGLLQRYR